MLHENNAPQGASDLEVLVPAAFVSVLREELRQAQERAEERTEGDPPADDVESREDARFDAALDFMLSQIAGDDPRCPQTDTALAVPRGEYGAERLRELLTNCTQDELAYDLRCAGSPGERARLRALLADCGRVIDQLESGGYVVIVPPAARARLREVLEAEFEAACDMAADPRESPSGDPYWPRLRAMYESLIADLEAGEQVTVHDPGEFGATVVDALNGVVGLAGEAQALAAVIAQLPVMEALAP